VSAVAFTTIDVNAAAGRDMGMANLFVDILRKDVLLNVSVFLAGYFLCSWGMIMLSGKPKKAVLDYRVIYKVVAIETDDTKSTVKIDLKDTRTGTEVTVQKVTKNLKYFKDYVNLNGDTMPGSIAAVV